MVTETETRSDSSIGEDVQFELKWDPKISSTEIAISVKEGVVTLAGFVSSYWEKIEAEKAAKHVNGVKGPFSICVRDVGGMDCSLEFKKSVHANRVLRSDSLY